VGSVPVVSPPALTSADRPPSAAAAVTTAPPSAETDHSAEPHHPEKHTSHEQKLTAKTRPALVKVCALSHLPLLDDVLQNKIQSFQ